MRGSKIISCLYEIIVICRRTTQELWWIPGALFPILDDIVRIDFSLQIQLKSMLIDVFKARRNQAKRLGDEIKHTKKLAKRFLM